MAKGGREEGPQPPGGYFVPAVGGKDTPGKTQPNQRYVYNEAEFPVAQEDKSEVTKKASGVGTKEFFVYFASILGIGVIGFFLSPGIPDEILVQALIALVGLARQRYLSKK